MSTFTVVSDLALVHRRDFPVSDEAILNPLDSDALVGGEWLEMDATTGKLKRGSNGSTNMLVFPVHAERGRYDVQSIKKVNVLYLGMYEAETTIVDTTSLVVGSPLLVKDTDFGGVDRRALALSSRTANDVIVGYVTKVLSNSKIRFVHFANEMVY